MFQKAGNTLANSRPLAMVLLAQLGKQASTDNGKKGAKPSEVGNAGHILATHFHECFQCVHWGEQTQRIDQAE